MSEFYLTRPCRVDNFSLQLSRDKIATIVKRNFIFVDETIETVVKRSDNDNVQLLCRVTNLKNILKFCRFERVNDDAFGLNLQEGMASGNYRYYGDGFAKGECGVEIKNMNGDDKTQWRCFLGLVDYADAMNVKMPEADRKVYKHSSVLDASDDWNKLKSKLTSFISYVTFMLN